MYIYGRLFDLNYGFFFLRVAGAYSKYIEKRIRND